MNAIDARPRGFVRASAPKIVEALSDATAVVVIVDGTETVRLTGAPAVVGVTGFGENAQVIPAGALGHVS